jgi:hypothetical protein
MQDEIVARLSSELGVQLIEAEARRAARSPSWILWISVSALGR